jgi:hypothetical protein
MAKNVDRIKKNKIRRNLLGLHFSMLVKTKVRSLRMLVEFLLLIFLQLSVFFLRFL